MTVQELLDWIDKNNVSHDADVSISYPDPDEGRVTVMPNVSATSYYKAHKELVLYVY